MGLRARLMQGGRCVLASLPIGEEPFDTLTDPIRVSEIAFSTVGGDRMKCLRPVPFFQLPMLKILDCPTPESIEARIRSAWHTHLIELRSACNWLAELHVDSRIEGDGSLLSAPIPGEDRPVRVQVRERNRVILPSRGPLSKVTLRRAEDRVLRVSPSVHTSIDFEMAISNRMEELVRIDSRLKDRSRRQAMKSGSPPLQNPATPRKHRLLLVGPRIPQERPVIDSLRLRNYDVEVATSQQEALDLYQAASPELVLADIQIGRSEGIELIPALRELVGIEEIPLVLVDSNPRSARRLAAQRAGAAGYLSYPIDVSRIAKRLVQMVDQPRRRRFTRYPQQLTVHLSGAAKAWTATSLGRGGAFIRCEDEFQPDDIVGGDIALHEIGRSVNVELEIVYTGEDDGARGVGTRFHRFNGRDESVLIDYLHNLYGESPQGASL